MAALTAQPPLTTMNSLVMHLPPGCGNYSTRNTMSCTAMPAHRMMGTLEELTVALHPGAYDVVGDGDRRRTGQSVGMLSHQHGGAFVLGEPAAVDQLVGIHLDVVVERLGETAVHQRHRERPGLRVEILHAAAFDAGLFQGFAPHRILERFAGLDEAGETRPHGCGEPAGAAEQSAVAVHGEHDRDRVGAWEMLDLAGRAGAFPAGVDHVGFDTAVGAEAVP